MDKKTLNYQEFIEKYKVGEITILVDKNKAGDFVLSKFADKYNKPAHLFWTWLGKKKIDERIPLWYKQCHHPSEVSYLAGPELLVSSGFLL